MSIDEIAIRLRAARKNAGMTQAEAASHLGITYQAISNYERGITRVDTDTLVKLCAVYNIAIGDVLDTEEVDKPSSVQDYDGLDEYLEVLKNRAECRLLFSVAKESSKEDVEKAVAIIEALRRTEGR